MRALLLLVACAAACTATPEPDAGGAFPPDRACICDRGSDCVATCVCDPDCSEPEGGDGDADTDADTDADADADADADHEITCGNGACEPGEDGALCGLDCCDERTPCDATWGGAGVLYCRAMNGGGYWWWTAEDTTAMCDEEEELGAGTYECGGTRGTCCALGGGWREGACS